jgi:hypothetical protein
VAVNRVRVLHAQRGLGFFFLAAGVWGAKRPRRKVKRVAPLDLDQVRVVALDRSDVGLPVIQAIPRLNHIAVISR